MGPYWSDLNEDIYVLKDLFKDAFNALKEGGGKWVMETVENNALEASTQGKVAVVIVFISIMSHF